MRPVVKALFLANPRRAGPHHTQLPALHLTTHAIHCHRFSRFSLHLLHGSPLPPPYNSTPPLLQSLLHPAVQTISHTSPTPLPPQLFLLRSPTGIEVNAKLLQHFIFFVSSTIFLARRLVCIESGERCWVQSSLPYTWLMTGRVMFRVKCGCL